MATTLLILISPSSTVLLCEHMQMQSIKKVLNNCWGFIYGTVRSVCCPLQNQRIVCNGHKRVHALKFQPTVTPNGLIANLYGPVCEWKYTCIQKVIIKLNPLSFPGLSQFSSEGNTIFGVIYCIFA